MFTMNDLHDFINDTGDCENLEVAFREDAKIWVNGERASKRVTDHLMRTPLMRSILDFALQEFNTPQDAATNKAVRKLLREYA